MIILTVRKNMDVNEHERLFNIILLKLVKIELKTHSIYPVFKERVLIPVHS
jgi:hypothetical protein